MSIPSVSPGFEKGCEFVQTSYYSDISLITRGTLCSLTTSRGIARRKIYIGMLPYFNDIANFSKAPRPSLGSGTTSISLTASSTEVSSSPTITGTHTTSKVLNANNAATPVYRIVRPPNDNEGRTAYENVSGVDSPQSIANLTPWGSGVQTMERTISETINNQKYSRLDSLSGTMGQNPNSGYSSPGFMQFQIFVDFELNGQNKLTLPYCTFDNTFRDGFSADGTGYASGIYGNVLEAGENTIRVMKNMTYDGVAGFKNLLINPFTTVVDCDTITLRSTYTTTSLYDDVFIYLACQSEVAI